MEQYKWSILKEPTDKLVVNCRLGCMIEDDMNGNSWFVGNDCHLITLESRQYWFYLLEKSLENSQYRGHYYTYSRITRIFSKTSII